MATFIFLLSYIFYTIFLTHITTIYLLPVWLVLNLLLGLITVLFIYFLQFPIVYLLRSSHPYKTYLMRSLAYLLNHIFLRLKVTAKNVENVPLEGKLVVYANHKSYTDAFALMEVFPRAIALTPKKSVMKLPLISLWLKAYGVFPINRRNPRETAKDLQKAVETIKKGHAILLFPEGSIANRLKDKVEDMKAGAFKLPLKAEANILIVKYEGNDLLRKRLPFKTSRRSLTFLPVVSYEQIKEMTTQDIANLVMSKINET
jgi:1-acyl-sn-glycerol-3-phosphate acyltransferase